MERNMKETLQTLDLTAGWDNGFTMVQKLAAGVVHQIRNPLSVMKGYLQIMKDQIGQERSGILLEQVREIEDFLYSLEYLARADKEKREHWETVSIQAILGDVLNELHPSIAESGIRCAVQFSGPTRVMGDASRLRLLFGNLISNAVDSMPNGGTLSIWLRETSRGCMSVRIRDTGSGIAPERLKQLGQPHYSNREKGIGLGLLMCRSVISLHDGRLHITSGKDQGTSVKILLPVHPANSACSGLDEMMNCPGF